LPSRSFGHLLVIEDKSTLWLQIRRELPIGAVLCVIHGPTAGRRWEASAARKQLHHAAAEAA
jgi:hypothetical protein